MPRRSEPTKPPPPQRPRPSCRSSRCRKRSKAADPRRCPTRARRPATRSLRRPRTSDVKFALLLYEDDAERVAKTDQEVSVCLAYAEAMRKAGILVGGERLQPARSAATVRASDAGMRVLDGPYAEAKEQLGGFH